MWLAPHAEFTLPAIDRDTDWRVTLETKVWRPRGVPLPRVRIDVDGVTVADQIIKRNVDLGITAPRRPGTSGIIVGIDTTPPYLPVRDPRKLGVAIASITLEPIGGWPRAPRRAAASGRTPSLFLRHRCSPESTSAVGRRVRDSRGLGSSRPSCAGSGLTCSIRRTFLCLPPALGRGCSPRYGVLKSGVSNDSAQPRSSWSRSPLQRVT